MDPWGTFDEQGGIIASEKPVADPWGVFTSEEMEPRPTPPKPSGLLRRGLGDTAISALKGAISLPEAAVGLLDIPTMGLAGKAVKGLGVDFKGSREFLDTLLTPEQQQLNREVQETEGFFPTVGAMIQRPSTIAHQVIESAPSMIGAGSIGRGLLKVAPKIGAVVGGATGEGAISAGQTVEQVRQTMPTGLIDPRQAAVGLTSGAITGLFGILGGKLARRLEVPDVETLLTGGKLNVARTVGELEAKKGILRKVIESAITEGAFEELPQSAQEQIAQNFMLGKPAGENVANAAAAGMLAGSVIGGGVGVTGHILTKTNPVVEQLKTDPLDQEIGKLMSELPQELEVVKVPPIAPPAIPPAPAPVVAPFSVAPSPVASTEIPAAVPEIAPQLKSQYEGLPGATSGGKQPREMTSGKPVRFEAGKKLNEVERKEVMNSIGDAYRENRAPRELKYVDERTGEEVYGYAYSPESMYVSDITGKKIRNYILLPDGRKAHPSELFPEITQTKIDAAFAQQEEIGKQEKYIQKQKDMRIVSADIENPKQMANLNYNKTNRTLENSYFAYDNQGRVVRVDGKDAKDVAYYKNQGFAQPGATSEGKPTLYRGSGRENAGVIYNEFTDRKALLGNGQFWALNKKDAKRYGSNVESKLMPDFSNPLTVKDDDEWTNIVRTALEKYDTGKNRISYPNPFGLSPEKMAIWRKGISDYLKEKSHDALVVNMDAAQGDDAKTLRKVFGHSQVFIPEGKQSWEITRSVQGDKVQLLAYEGRKNVGEISVVPRPDGNLEVSNVLIWPEFQRQGKGTELYRKAFNEAQSQGKKLFISNDRTPDAIKLHEQFSKKGILGENGEINFKSPSVLTAKPALKLRLPRELAGAKPRYGYRDKQFTLQFENDVDKASYISIQDIKSKRDSGYFNFVKQATGLSNEEILSHGQSVKNTIKSLAKDAESGTKLTIPTQELNVGRSTVSGSKPIQFTATNNISPPVLKDSPELAGTSESKQPWEMTNGELEKIIEVAQIMTGHHEYSRLSTIGQKNLADKYFPTIAEAQNWLLDNSGKPAKEWDYIKPKDIYKKALAEGKPVLPSVLKDYPEPKTTPGGKQPWEMTKEEFIANPPEGFSYKQGRGYAAQRGNKITHVSDSFFDLDVTDKKDLINHEIGHDLVRNFNQDFKNVFEPLKKGIGKDAYGQNREIYENPFGFRENPEEIIADTYASLFEPFTYEKGGKYDALRQRVAEVATREGLPVPLEILKDSPELGTKITAPPEATITTPKEQKKFLIDKIDEAIPLASKETPEKFEVTSNADTLAEMAAAKKANEERFGTVTIQVPNDGEFTILNTKETLIKFKKDVSNAFPVTLPGPKEIVPNASSLKPTGKRITGKEISYYNEFKPRKQELVRSKITSVIDKENIPTQFYDGTYYSDGQYIIKTPKPEKLYIRSKDITPDLTRVIPTADILEPATLVGEFSYISESEAPGVHIITKDGTDIILDSRYVDSILTLHPVAKVFAEKNIPVGKPIVFKTGEDVVGVVMPLRNEGQLEPFADRIAEVKTEAGMNQEKAQPSTIKLSTPLKKGVKENEKGLPKHTETVGTYGNEIEFLRQETSRELGREISTDAITPVLLDTSIKDIQKIARTWNQEIIWIKTNDSALNTIDGFVIDKTPGKIFINIKTKNPHFMILGHELLHTMQFESPELYIQLRELLRPEIQNMEEFKSRLTMTMADLGSLNKVDDSLGYEELLSRFVGDQFVNEKFWDNLAQSNPSIFEKLIQIAKRLVTEAINALGINHKMVSLPYFKDINKSRKILADAMSKYAKDKASEEINESGIKLSTSLIPPPAFYSKLFQIVQNATLPKMPVSQLKAFLKGKQVTDAEIENIIGNMQGTVTKQQVLDAIKENTTEFTDVMLGGSGTDRLDQLDRIRTQRDWTPSEYQEYKELASNEDRSGEAPRTKFDSVTSRGVEGGIPGSYRELTVTMPGVKSISNEGITANDVFLAAEGRKKEGAWQDQHSQYADIANPVIRIHFDDRNVSGKRILFIREMQSIAKTKPTSMPRWAWDRAYDIGVKRILSYAKENGYDGISWSTGQIVADRYSLAKQVDSVRYWETDSKGFDPKTNFFHIEMTQKDGTKVDAGEHPDFKLEGVVGKELTSKILKGEGVELFKGPKGVKEFRGLDLEIGGEGIKDTYDRRLPGLFKKYGKEEVSQIKIPGKPEARSNEEFDMEGFTDEGVQVLARPGKGKMINVPFIPITSNTPSSYARFSTPLAPLPTNQPASNTWESPASNRKANIFHSMFDRFVDLDASFIEIKKWLNKQGTILTDEQDPLLHVRQYPKIKADQERRFMETEVNPAFENAKKLGVSFGELQTYMHNFIAEHTNKTLAQRHIAKVDKENLTRKKPLPYDPSFEDGMSKIKTQDARNYLASLTPEQVQKYEAAAKPFWEMGKKNRDIAISYQLESPKTMAQWEKDNPFYLPLFRDMGKESNVYEGIGQGFTNVGGISKGRVGSEREVVNPIANLIMQRAKIISRGEKNKADIALANLVKKAPNSDWWKPATVRIREILSTDGTMVKVIDPTYKYEPNVIMSRQLDPKTGDIVERGVEFNKNNPRAERLANSLKNADMDKLGLILDASSKITRWISKANTEWSPTFGPTNFLRDWGFMLVNLSTTPIKGKQWAVSKKMPFALSMIYSEMRARRENKHSTNPLSQAFDDFQRYGGMQGYSDMFRSSDQMAKDIERQLAPPFNTYKYLQRGMTGAEGMVHWLSDFNRTLENATRFSVYQVAVENGMSKARAANLANEITVDFSKKGQIAIQAGALFAFFNASAQGSLNVYKALTEPNSGKIIMGGILFGAVQAALLSAWGFGDDEPPDFIKERNIIIPTGKKSYKTIPLPLGFNILPNIGRVLTEATMAGLDGKSLNPMGKIAKLISIFADSFNPLGGSGLSVQTIIPTPADPLVALAENLDWNRQQISRPDYSSLNPTPGFTRAKDTASYSGKGLSWALNMLTGGSQDSPGFFSPTPDQIDYLAGQFTGGLGRELTKVQHVVGAISRDEEIPAYRIPLISRFHGSTEGQAQESTRFYNNIKTMNTHEREIMGRRDRHESVTEYIKENPGARFFRMANKAESGIRRLQMQKRTLTERDASRESIKMVDVVIANRMKQFNKTIKNMER